MRSYLTPSVTYGSDTAAAHLSIQAVSKVYRGRQAWTDKLLRQTSDDFVAIADITLDIEPNTFVSIIGPSGCGKSTLLNILAGLSRPSSGSILLNGKPIQGPGPDRGVVFQNYALMPWMTVAENLRFAIDTVYPAMPAAQQKTIVQEYIDLVGLRGAEHKHPHELQPFPKTISTSIVAVAELNPRLTHDLLLQ
jgi:nitrate/nitrite transport system ATP-binding protein